jgi:hypothetical protein
MGLSRRQFGQITAGLYIAGGLLLLSDFVADPGRAQAHIPLAWHVFPVSLLASLGAAIGGLSAPLDPVWFVSFEVIVASFLLALMLCALALLWIISGWSRKRSPSDPDAPEALDEGQI